METTSVIQAMDEELARQDAELEAAMANLEHSSHRRGWTARSRGALEAIEAVLFGRRAAPAVATQSPPFSGTRA